MRGTWSLLHTTFNEWYADRAQRLGAALAYYTIFALTPGLVIMMALAGLLLGPGAEAHIITQIRELIGDQGAAAIDTLDFVISFAVITGSFALIFRLLPDVKIAWRDVGWGPRLLRSSSPSASSSLTCISGRAPSHPHTEQRALWWSPSSGCTT
jgi:uncharacterized BrkB/YihY/UPF0761 family membrane protein